MEHNVVFPFMVNPFCTRLAAQYVMVIVKTVFSDLFYALINTFLRPPFCCGTFTLDLLTAPEVIAVTLVVAVAVVVAIALVIAVAPLAVAADTVQELVAAPCRNLWQRSWN